MATGVIASYDPEEETGYIQPDADRDDDLIPFDLDVVEDFDQGPMLRAGQRVEFTAQGGLAGVMARSVRRLAG